MNDPSIYPAYRFPPDVIADAVRLYHRFTLSLRDIEELIAERGFELSYETINGWRGWECRDHYSDDSGDYNEPRGPYWRNA